jgi:hypothetical protein
MDDILDMRHYSCTVCHDDQSPLVGVNKVGLPRIILPTFMYFSSFHAFKDGAPRMIWDSNLFCMEKSIANEQK